MCCTTWKASCDYPFPAPEGAGIGSIANSVMTETKGEIVTEFEKPGDCPSGTDCPVHFRLDLEQRDDAEALYSAVSYVGEFCVMTSDNPKYLGNPSAALMHVLLHKRLPDDAYQTAIYRVGDGCLYDIATIENGLVPMKTYDSGDTEGAQTAHHLAVMVASDM